MTPQAQLERLLRSLFSPDELARFLRAHADTAEIVELLAPGAAASMVADAVQALDRRGLIDDGLFDRLVAERPRRETDIREVQAAFSTEGTAGTKPGKTPAKPASEGSPLARLAKIGAALVAGIPVLIKLGMEILAAIQGAPGGEPDKPAAVDPPAALEVAPEDGTDPGSASPPGVAEGPPGQVDDDPPGGSPAGPKPCVSLEGGPELILPAPLPQVTARFSDGSVGPASGLSWTVEPSALAKVDTTAGNVVPERLGSGTLRPAMGGCAGRVTVRTADPHVAVGTRVLLNTRLTLPSHPVASANGLDATLDGVTLLWSLGATPHCSLTGLALKGLSEGSCELRVRTADGAIDRNLTVEVVKLNVGDFSTRAERPTDLQLAPRGDLLVPNGR